MGYRFLGFSVVSFMISISSGLLILSLYDSNFLFISYKSSIATLASKVVSIEGAEGFFMFNNGIGGGGGRGGNSDRVTFVGIFNIGFNFGLMDA